MGRTIIRTLQYKNSLMRSLVSKPREGEIPILSAINYSGELFRLQNDSHPSTSIKAFVTRTYKKHMYVVDIHATSSSWVAETVFRSMSTSRHEKSSLRSLAITSNAPGATLQPLTIE